jgi:hypothetical protein
MDRTSTPHSVDTASSSQSICLHDGNTMYVDVPPHMRVVLRRGRDRHSQYFAPSLEIADMLIGTVTVHGEGFAARAHVHLWVIDMGAACIRSTTEVQADDTGRFDEVLDSGCLNDSGGLVDYNAQVLAITGSGAVASALYTAYCGIFAP